MEGENVQWKIKSEKVEKNKSVFLKELVSFDYETSREESQIYVSEIINASVTTDPAHQNISISKNFKLAFFLWDIGKRYMNKSETINL